MRQSSKITCSEASHYSPVWAGRQTGLSRPAGAFESQNGNSRSQSSGGGVRVCAGNTLAVQGGCFPAGAGSRTVGGVYTLFGAAHPSADLGHQQGDAQNRR